MGKGCREGMNAGAASGVPSSMPKMKGRGLVLAVLVLGLSGGSCAATHNAREVIQNIKFYPGYAGG